jgi:hypothetical protein
LPLFFGIGGEGGPVEKSENEAHHDCKQQPPPQNQSHGSIHS